jgi:hypothetical protein
VVIVIAVVAAVLLWPRSGPSAASPSAVGAAPTSSGPRTTPTPTATATAQPDVSPVTEAATPEASAAPSSTPAPGPGAGDKPRLPADVVVTVARWSEEASRAEIGGYVDGLVEDGGSCTATFTLGARSVVVSGQAFADVTTTSCGDLAAAGTQLSTGTWTAVLSYDSPTSSGASASVSIGVP